MAEQLVGTICAYCGEAVLTGNEVPEHALPAAINARFTTFTVCNPCNEWAGKHIDQPWLDDPFVLSTRYTHQIPDRKGQTLKHDPLLTGTTEDGRRIRLGQGGKPELLNSPIHHDEERGEIQISAPDRETYERMLDRALMKVGKTRDDVELGEPQVIEDQPQITATAEIVPGRWERLAAKAALALLADKLPQAWRQGESAGRLRERVRDLELKPVQLRATDAFHPFAGPPSSAVVVNEMAGPPTANVSLLGQYAVMLPLGEDMRGVDLAWVSDPLQPSESQHGSSAQVVAIRNGLDWPGVGLAIPLGLARL